MGGSGNSLGPMAYCVAGMASCFVTAYANVAPMQGAKTMDVAVEPITEGIKFALDVQSKNADRKKLDTFEDG
jgi:uncharacterized OsmC-like protein